LVVTTRLASRSLFLFFFFFLFAGGGGCCNAGAVCIDAVGIGAFSVDAGGSVNVGFVTDGGCCGVVVDDDDDDDDDDDSSLVVDVEAAVGMAIIGPGVGSPDSIDVGIGMGGGRGMCVFGAIATGIVLLIFYLVPRQPSLVEVRHTRDDARDCASQTKQKKCQTARTRELRKGIQTEFQS